MFGAFGSRLMTIDKQIHLEGGNFLISTPTRIKMQIPTLPQGY
jgi:hypothetical protein